MAIITFTAPHSSAVLTLPAVRIPYFSPPVVRKPLQRSFRTYSGKIITSDVATTIVDVEFTIRGLSPSQFYQWRKFVISEVSFNLYPFNLSIVDVNNLDLGLGRGNNTIINCHWREEFNSTEGLESHRAPDVFDITIPLTYRIDENNKLPWEE